MNCQALCSCNSGYGGISCAYDTAALAARGAMRAQMCGALLNSTKLSNPSPQLIESMTTSLYQSYTPYEVVDDRTRSLCSELLRVISRAAGSGQLGKSKKKELPTLIAKTMSLFAVGSANGVGAATTSPHQEDAIDSVGDLQKGMLKSMVGGQKPGGVVSDNVRMSASKSLPSDLKGALLGPPQSEAEATYGAPGPRIVLPKNGTTSRSYVSLVSKCLAVVINQNICTCTIQSLFF